MFEFLGNFGLLAAIGGGGIAIVRVFRSRRNLSPPNPWGVDFSMLVILVAMSISTATLLVAFLTDHFEVQFVASHSERSLSVWRKVAALWSGQEGSESGTGATVLQPVAEETCCEGCHFLNTDKGLSCFAEPMGPRFTGCDDIDEYWSVARLDLDRWGNNGRRLIGEYGTGAADCQKAQARSYIM